MKTNRKTRQCTPTSDRLWSGAIAKLLALSFAASISFYCNDALAQSKGKRAESPGAQRL